MLTSADTESVELGAFLRHYAGAVLTRLPGQLLAVGSHGQEHRPRRAGCTSPDRYLRQPNRQRDRSAAQRRGHRLDWTADEYKAAVEISDDGPGLPSDIAAALNAGKRIRSTKPGGYGLGLLGVRSLLAKVGGQLSLIATPSGTAWLTTLPLLSTDRRLLCPGNALTLTIFP
ncbi:ATP-binding protein [Streptomyces anulatus]|uniref:ATP-binding protein n=1 Tax=Streptomyces anulatus TaxID=1892 RepID=UPI0036665809